MGRRGEGKGEVEGKKGREGEKEGKGKGEGHVILSNHALGIRAVPACHYYLWQCVPMT